MYKINGKEYNCSISITSEIFNDKWKLGIIWYLLDGEMRYKEISEKLNEITQKTLTVKLRELEEKGLIKREVFPEVPPKVVYSLTPIGEKLRDVLNTMHSWGIEYTKEFGEIVGESCSPKL
ncbi:MAG: helix-turn-helix transcriptional regulator [Campylobacterales bacterium]|nr:helix-turn-helix transcriptional regulator [Campylobacterales bacterium]